ncbi:retrovirus-related pol polyprotein from transposon TNT 1-94 [Tanacetum coccineum]
MSNTNNTMQTQTSNALHNAIMEAGGKDHPLMLAPEGSSETTTKRYMENYKNVSYDIRNQLNAEAEEIDNDIYSIIDACPNVIEMSKAIERNRGKAIVNSLPPTYDQEPDMVAEDDTFIANQDNTPRTNIVTGYDNQRVVNVAGARENIGTHVVQQSRIQCYKCKEYGHVARECQKPKRAKDSSYHKEKMLLCKQDEAGIQLSVDQVIPDAADNSGPIFDVEPLQKDDDDLAKERDLHASLIEKQKCKIDDSKNRNKLFESSNKTLVDKLKSEIKEFKNKNKCLEQSLKNYKKANTDLAEINKLTSKDIDKFQTEHERYNDVNYALEVEIKCAKAKGQSVQTMNMLNCNCKTSFVKPEFLKKAQRANPCLYDIGCYNNNLALMLALESDEMIRLAQESRSKLSDLIKTF